MSNIDKAFTGSIPNVYETYLVPLIFDAYAEDMKSRVGSAKASKILEIAAGTGVVTRALATLPNPQLSIVATDLNQAMIDQAAAIGTARPVQWKQADAMALPFPDGAFDAVVCQFGVMFFPDKPKAFSEARRVLKPGGVYIFNVWDRITDNEFADTIEGAVGKAFLEDPPRFLSRTPHGYHDGSGIERDLADGGFTGSPQIATVTARSRAASPMAPAIAYCQGTPLRSEIEARGASRLQEVTEMAAAALARRFGPKEVDGKIQAHIVTVRK